MIPKAAYAIVTAVIEVKVDAWGAESTLGQASEQAIIDATKKINDAFGLDTPNKTDEVRLIRADQVEVRWKANALTLSSVNVGLSARHQGEGNGSI